jgi:hypothetical protein
MEMMRSGYNRLARTLPRQPPDDPRKHLDARMNELLDELCGFPSAEKSRLIRRHATADGSLEGVVRSAQRDPDLPPAQTTPELALNRELTFAQGRGAVRDRSSPTPSAVAFDRITGMQAERLGF